MASTRTIQGSCQSGLVAKADFLHTLKPGAGKPFRATGAPKTCAPLNFCATHAKQAREFAKSWWARTDD
jgi:hypothetical protein